VQTIALKLIVMCAELRQPTNKRRKICQEFLSTIEASGKSFAYSCVMHNISAMNVIHVIKAINVVCNVI